MTAAHEPRVLGTPAATPPTRRSLLAMLGPAFVAAVAYVDPGNVAANVTAGATHGYLLLWVLVLANLMAVLVQYLSAKLAVVTGSSLPAILGQRLPRPARLAYWGQAEVVAMATDLAEVIGGAVALQLLFHLPLLLGGLVTGVVSTALLAVEDRGGARRFEMVVMGLLAVVVIGFASGVLLAPPDPSAAAAGLVPRFQGRETVLLAASMLGATVMPHAIYLHSSMTNDHLGPVPPERRGVVLRMTRVDVLLALVLAGAVNICMLLVAAASLRGVPGTDTLAGAQAAISARLGRGAGILLALGLLASGLASTSVGAYAGSSIMHGLLRVRVPVLVRRVVTLLPAIACLAAGVDPTRALVISQVVLSLGIPFALVPLVRVTGDRALMGEHADGLPMKVASLASVSLVVALNVVLLWLTLAGSL